MADYLEGLDAIPDYMQGGLIRYIEKGIPPGSFLLSLLENNLKETFARADSTNARLVREYVMYLYNQAPGSCWGSPEKVSDWLGHGGLQGTEQRANEIEPLPCPFCASDQVCMSFSATVQSPEPFGRFVECENCAASGPAVDIPPMGDAAAKARAAELWNARRTPPSLGDQVTEALREALEETLDALEAEGWFQNGALIKKACAALTRSTAISRAEPVVTDAMKDAGYQVWAFEKMRPHELCAAIYLAMHKAAISRDDGEGV